MAGDLERRWMRAGGIAGVATVIAYFITLVAPPPWPIRRLFFFAIGPLGIIFILGLDHVLSRPRKTVAATIGTVFGVVGMAIMNLMAVVQSSIDARMDDQLPAGTDSATLNWIRNSVNSVHLGMDVSFDIFILVSAVLFGVAMLGHPRFGAKFGIPGAIAAIATLVLNLYAFPLPPDIDLGPLVSLWLFAVAIRLCFCATDGPSVVSAGDSTSWPLSSDK
jgi:hypothetical protein